MNNWLVPFLLWAVIVLQVKINSLEWKIEKIKFILILDGGEDERTGARARRELTSNIKELFRYVFQIDNW